MDAKKDIIYKWIVNHWIVNSWIVYRELAQSLVVGLTAFVEVWISKRQDYKLEKNDSDLEWTYSTEKKIKYF